MHLPLLNRPYFLQSWTHSANRLKVKRRNQLLSYLMLLLSWMGLMQTPIMAQENLIDKEVIRQILVENPDIMVDALMSLQIYQQAQKEMDILSSIQKHHDALFGNQNPKMVFGDLNAPFAIVEFFDYNCGFCKKAYPAKMEFLEKNPDVRLILKEYPILSQDSLDAARVAFHVVNDENADYHDFHHMMMTLKGRATLETAIEAAIKAGANQKKLERKLALNDADPAFKMITQNHTIAQELGIEATPTYVFEDEVVPGLMSMSRFEQKLQDLKTKAK